jgi:AraC family transcriptional regulator
MRLDNVLYGWLISTAITRTAHTKFIFTGGSRVMATKPLVRIEDHSTERVASFFVNCPAPEGAAWDLLRDWVTKNVPDYQSRRFIGCAPKGHHPVGADHHADEEVGAHEYTAQMLLLEGEGDSAWFFGADVCAAPQGLFLVGDVVMDEFNDDGTVNLGSSMENSFGALSATLQEMGGYAFELQVRPYYEEHIFSPEWFNGKGELAGFKLWLPIRKL